VLSTLPKARIRGKRQRPPHWRQFAAFFHNSCLLSVPPRYHFLLRSQITLASRRQPANLSTLLFDGLFVRSSLVPNHQPMNLAAPAAIALAITALSLSGCASIVSGRYAEVAVESFPSHANVVIQDKQGRTVSSFTTPGVAKLKRQGRFFLPARHTATIVAPGYQPEHVPINSTLNPWLLGNVLIGGIPGIVVDSATGAAWRPNRSEIHRQLTPLEGQPEFILPSASASSDEADSSDEAASVALHDDAPGESTSRQ
jgi:hypothetical protein